jgi:CheY-like chemotaxis protein
MQRTESDVRLAGPPRRDPAAAHWPSDRNTGRTPQAPSILIVEDEMISALHLEQILIGLGYGVCATAASAPEAVQAAEDHRPDLVLMDIRLAGGTDGITAATEIRARLDIPSLFVTGHADSQTIERAQAANHIGFINKPYRAVDIQAAVEAALRRLQ